MKIAAIILITAMSRLTGAMGVGSSDVLGSINVNVQTNMKPELKIIAIGAGLCVIGAILLDYHINMTGSCLMALGGMAIIIGPLWVSI